MSRERPTGKCNQESLTCGTVTKTVSSPLNNFCELVHAYMVLAMSEQGSDLVAFRLSLCFVVYLVEDEGNTG